MPTLVFCEWRSLGGVGEHLAERREPEEADVRPTHGLDTVVEVGLTTETT
jgi:hypothetical protein